jgi:type III secretory pathway component EscS
MPFFFISNSLYLVLVLSCVPLLVSCGFSLLTAILQTATQVQEQTTLFLVKLGSFSIVAFLFGNYAFEALSHHLREGFRLLIVIGGT